MTGELLLALARVERAAAGGGALGAARCSHERRVNTRRWTGVPACSTAVAWVMLAASAGSVGPLLARARWWAIRSRPHGWPGWPRGADPGFWGYLRR